MTEFAEDRERTPARVESPISAAEMRPHLANFLERWALVGLLVTTFVVFALNDSTSSTFLSAVNLRNVLADQAVVGVLAIGSLLPLVARQFDLSVGAVAALSQILVAQAMSAHGLPLAVAIALGLAMGAMVGAFNGLLVAYLKVNALIATLGTMTVIGGIIFATTNGNSIVSGISPTLLRFGEADLLFLPLPAFVLAAIAALVWYVLSQTPWGRFVHFVGSNPQAARLVGLSVERIVLQTFVASGIFSGIAGVLLLAKNGNASPQTGADFMLLAVSAAFLGATAIEPGRFNVAGTLVAILFLAFSVNGLTLAGVDAWINNVFAGTALIVAVALGSVLGGKAGKHQ